MQAADAAKSAHGDCIVYSYCDVSDCMILCTNDRYWNLMLVLSQQNSATTLQGGCAARVKHHTYCTKVDDVL